MKKRLLLFICAFVLGGLMAYITKVRFQNLENNHFIIAYQLGIYSSYENALKMAKDAKGAIIVNKNNTYQVIGAVANSKASEEKMENLLKQENLTYYPKKISLNSKALKTVEEYELLIRETEDFDALKVLNEQLLKSLEERMN